MKRALLLASILGLASSCGKGRDSAGNGSPSAGSRPREDHGPDAMPTGLRISAARTDAGEYALSIEEHGDERAHLGASLEIERHQAAGWTRVEARELTLRPDCESRAPTCIELARGGALRPPAWSARSGKGQCTTAAEGTDVPAGEYRVVVRTCDGAHRVVGTPFTVQR